MRRGSIIGCDISKTTCQISYYNQDKREPETLNVGSDHDQVPLIIGRYRDGWVYGKEARRLKILKKGHITTGLLEKSLRGEKVQLGAKVYEGAYLLTQFLECILKSMQPVKAITFTTREINEDLYHVLKGIAIRLGIEKDYIFLQDYKESFCNYMLYQPKELWQYEAALFFCDRDEVKAYMLRKLQMGPLKGKEGFVTVDKVASAKMEELAAVYPVLNVDKAKEADLRFRIFVESVFEKKIISSVFLTGEGFENNWYPNALKVLCNGRRAFMGHNLYSKGACNHAYQRLTNEADGTIYLDEHKLKEQVCIKMKVQGEEKWYPLVSWGNRWYELDKQLEVLCKDTEEIELHIESLVSRELYVEKISLEGMPKRNDYSIRMEITVLFLDENTCKIIFKDLGFGELYQRTGFQVEKTIQLGGTNE